MSADPLALAWCAGLFDGEGCVAIYPNAMCTKPDIVTLRVTNTDEATVRRVALIAGAGTVRRAQRDAPRRPYWTWFCGSRAEVHRILLELKPFLVTKAAQVGVALEYLDGIGNQHRERIRRLKVV